MKKSTDSAFVSEKMLTFAATTIRLLILFYKSQTPLHVNVGDFSYLCSGFYISECIWNTQKKKSNKQTVHLI